MPILCVPFVIFPRCSVLIYVALFSSFLEFYFEVLHQGPPNLRSFKQAVKRLEEVAVSCRGLERVQWLRRWLFALKEVERLSSDSKGKHEKSPIELLASDESKDSPTKPTSVRTKPGFYWIFMDLISKCCLLFRFGCFSRSLILDGQVYYVDPETDGGLGSFRNVFLHSQALEGITLSMVSGTHIHAAGI